MSTPSLFVAWSIDAFSLFTASSIFAFAVAFSSSVAFGVWSISAFLGFRRFIDSCFSSSFLTTVGWILLVNLNHLISQCLHLRYLLTVYRILSCCYSSSTFAFAAAFSSSVAFGVWSISAFRLPPLYQSLFSSSFLTTVGWILLVNLSHLISQCLHRHYLLLGLLTLSHYLLPHRLSLLLPPFLHLSH